MELDCGLFVEEEELGCLEEQRLPALVMRSQQLEDGAAECRAPHCQQREEEAPEGGTFQRLERRVT